MNTTTIGLGTLYVALATAATMCLAQAATAQTETASASAARPAIVTDVVTDHRPHDGPPHGIPPELHRKVLHLYKRIHNAYPDASRKRILYKVAQELGISPRRLWNAYHSGGGGTHDLVDILPADRVTDRRLTDRAVSDRTDRVRDRVVDRPRSSDRVRIRPDRPVRDRPQRDRPGRD